MTRSRILFRLLLLPAAAAAAGAALGCSGGVLREPAPGETEVPYPVNLLLPQELAIHPFTGTKDFDEAGGAKGIDVQIEFKDAFGDSGKAFGTFRFELYTFRADSPDPKGERITFWEVSLMDPKTNLLHWKSFAQRYQFKLEWQRTLPVGRRYALAVTYSSPYSTRLEDERIFVVGQ